MRKCLITAVFAIASISSSPDADGQSVVIGNINCSVVKSTTDSRNTRNEYRAIQNDQKVKKLLEYWANQVGAPVSVNENGGFTTSTTVRFQRAQSTVQPEYEVRISVLPIMGNATKNKHFTASLLIVSFPSMPGLAYPRLMGKMWSNDKLISEWAYISGRNPVLRDAKNGDCVFRSSLRLIGELNPAASRALESALSSTKTLSTFDALKFMCDVNGRPFGQRDLALMMSLVGFSNLQEEFAYSYVSGTIDNYLRPTIRDNPIVRALKKELENVLKDLIKKAGTALFEFFKKILGF